MAATRSVELLFDEQTEARVRALWQALADVGVPSLAQHPGATNRPHVTLAAGEGMQLQQVPSFDELPVSVVFGGVVLFSARKGWVLAQAVVISHELMDLHAAVHRATVGAAPTTVPGRWSPHVTLSRRVRGDELERALDVLHRESALQTDAQCQLISARLWDAGEKTVSPLS